MIAGTLMLTLETLKAMNPGEIIAHGIALDDHYGINMTGSSMPLRWVAVRGDIYDWAIYCHHMENPIEWIIQHGDKVHSTRSIKRLVDVDDEALNMYRH